MSNLNPQQGSSLTPYNVPTAYILWALCFCGLSGLHRLYVGQIGLGLLWLFTWGLCGVGNFIDLFLIPSMVESSNFRHQARLGMMAQGSLSPSPSQPKQAGTLSKEQLRIELIRAASKSNGKLSVTQGVLATGADFKVIEDCLQDMMRGGYIGIDNDPDTGIVLYTFPEL